MKSKLLFFVLILGLPVWTFSQTSTKSGALKEILNQSYYADKALDSDLTKLNLVIPQDVDNPPVLIWIGGGAWAYVDRHNEMNLCRQMAKQGILVVSAGHRLSPKLLRGESNAAAGIKHPEHVKDIAHAFKWVFDHADEYGYSQDQIYVGGFSSGAHLSTLLAVDSRYLNQVGLSPDNIKAIIPVGGGYDIPHYRKILIEADPSYEEKHINAVFGTTNEQHLDASPTTYIDSLSTPILMISEGDTYQYSVVFEKLLKEKNYKKLQVLNAHGETHASLWKNLSAEAPSIYRNYIVDFIKAGADKK